MLTTIIIVIVVSQIWNARLLSPEMGGASVRRGARPQTAAPRYQRQHYDNQQRTAAKEATKTVTGAQSNKG